MNSLSKIGFIDSLFDVNEFIVSSLFNILFFISSFLKSFWTFSWNSFIASFINVSANLACPGNFINSFAIKSAFLVIESELANLDLISNNFIKIFWFPMTFAFSWLDKVIIFSNSIASFANCLLRVFSIICKSNLGHPAFTKVLHIPGFLLANAIKVLIIALHKSSSFIDLFSNFISEFTYNSEGITPFSSDKSDSLSLKNPTLFFNWLRCSIKLGLSVDFVITSEFKLIIFFNKFLYLSSLVFPNLSIAWSSNFLKVPKSKWSLLLEASHISLYLGLFSFVFKRLNPSIKDISFFIKSFNVVKSSSIPALKNSSTFKAQFWYIRLSSNFKVSSTLLVSGLKELAFFLNSFNCLKNSSNGINLFNKILPFDIIFFSISSLFGSFISSSSTFSSSSPSTSFNTVEEV